MTKPLKSITANHCQSISPLKLRPAATNARKHSASQIALLCESIKEFGMIMPILVDDWLNVIAGHARLTAALELGLENVLIIRLKHLTPQQVRAYTIADNRLAEHATWDELILKSEFTFLMEAELNGTFETCISITGFNIGEIDTLIGATSNIDDLDEASLITPERNQPTVSCLGDLWLMGKHKALCGDSKLLENYKQLIGGAKLSAIIMDGPYNIPIDGFVGGKGKTKRREFADGSGEMTSDQFTEFNKTVIGHTLGFLHNGGLVYAFMDWRHSIEILTAGKLLGLHHLNTATWVKNVAGMGSFLRSQTEFCHIWRFGDTAHRNNVMLGKNGRNRSNAWEYPSANSSKEGRKQLANHPTPKPVEMIMDIILDGTKTGDIICDPFLGSGTAIIAAEKAKRIAYGLELDPAYLDCIIRRWQNLSGKDAINARTSLSFSDHEKGLHLTKKSGGRHVRVR